MRKSYTKCRYFREPTCLETREYASDASCEFRRTNEEDPVLAMVGESGAIKLSGVLIPLAAEVDTSVMPDPGADWTDTIGSLRCGEAETAFDLEQARRVG